LFLLILIAVATVFLLNAPRPEVKATQTKKQAVITPITAVLVNAEGARCVVPSRAAYCPKCLCFHSC
jgi:hypothetical protein